MDYSPSSSSVHGILQARILERIAIPFSGDLPHPGIEPGSLVLADRFFTIWATRETQVFNLAMLLSYVILGILVNPSEPVSSSVVLRNQLTNVKFLSQYLSHHKHSLEMCLHDQSCPTVWSPMDCSLLGSPVYEVFPARIQEWIVISSSRRSSQPRDQTHVSCSSCIGRQILYHWATREAQLFITFHLILCPPSHQHMHTTPRGPHNKMEPFYTDHQP